MSRRLVTSVLVCALAFAGSTCRLDELIKTPIDGTLTIAPAAVGDSAARGSLALRVQSVEVTSVGTGRLSFRVERAQGSSWLALSATTGTAPDTLTATFDPAGLASGIYQDTIIVRSNNSASPALRVPVTFTIYDCRVVPIAADTTVSGAITASDCGAPHRAGGFARLFAFTGSAGDSISLILNGTGFDAYLVLDTSLAPAAVPLFEMDHCLGVPGDACVLYQVLPRTGTYVVEATSSGAGQTGGYLLSVRPPLPPVAPDSVRQFASDSVTAIPTGNVISETALVLQGSVRDSDLADSVRIEVEVRPMGVPFTGNPTAVSPLAPSGQRARVLVPGLSDDASYHWQIRAVDQTGRPSPWTPFGGNAESAPDFRVAIPQLPALPAPLAQFKADGLTAIPVGGANQTRSVVLRGRVTDPDPGGQLRFEVELRPVGIQFKDSANGNVTVANGDTATVTIPGLTNNVSYHWQARAVDGTGRASPWTPFGGNPETAADFTVAIQAVQLVFTTQPSTTAAGAAIAPPVEVTAHDALGAPVSGFTDTVTITLAANPAGGTLSGTVRAAAVNGVATFANLRLDRSGTGYALRATSPSLTSTSTAFAIVPGAPAQFVFTQQPVSTAAGALITPPVQVTAKDASGNVVTSYTDSVSIAIGPGSPAASTLLGTLKRAAAGGVATFDDLRINTAGTGYTLVAGDGTIAGTSLAFDILPQGAARLTFTVEPVDAVAGVAIAPPIKVTALDSLGNVVTGFTGDIAVAVAANPGSGTLRGNTTVTAAAGVATFADLSVDKTGAGYTLTATAAGAASVTSAPFDISPAPASQLAFTVQPITVTAGTAITPSVQVSVRDSLGNAVPTYTDSITLAIGVNPAGGALLGTRTVASSGGVATFADLSVDRAGNGYTLAAAASGLVGAASSAFDVLPGPAVRLEFSVQPVTTAAGNAIAPAVEVTARDAFGNTATGFTGFVTVGLAANPTGGVLFGTTTVTAAAGIAAFANLAIDRSGAGYTLATSGAGLAGDTSAAFTITAGAAGGLSITTPPSTTAQSGIALAQQPAVQLRDQSGNPVLQSGVQVSAAIATGAGSATLAGSTATTDGAGVATFAGLAISGPVGNYTLVFGGAGLTPATSGTIALTAGPAAKLGITTQPSATAQNGVPFAQQPVLQIQDAAGNPVAQGGVDVAAGIATGGGALSGTSPVPTDGLGQVAFTDLAIAGLVGNRTLAFTAAGAGLTGVTSAVVTLEAGAATQIAVSAGNGQTATAGTAVAIPPAVIVRDQSGNPVAGVAVTFAVVSGGGAVSPTTAVSTGANGIATVTAWTLGPTAGPNGLSAGATGLTGSPVLFDATAIVGAPATIAKSSGDNLSGEVATTLATPLEVLVSDALGNPVAGVAVTWAAASGGGSVNPATSLTDNAGHAVTSRTLGAIPGPNTTTATATLSGTPTSVTFTATAAAGGPTQMVKAGGQDQVDTVGATLPVPLSVRVTDQLNNVVPGVLITWFVTDGGGHVSPDTSRTDASGIAATTWTLGTATSVADSIQSARATGVAAAVDFLGFARPGTVRPDSSTVAVAPATITASSGTSAAGITVTARDGFGNRVPGKAVVLAATGAGNVLTQPAGPTDQNGIATGSLSSTVAEGKTVSASAGGIALSQTPSVTVLPGSGASLQFLVQPAPATAGAAIAPPVQVEVRDAFGNRATASTAGITLALGSNASGATLSGTAFQMAVAGVATFTDLSVDKSGTGYTLLATAPPRAPDTSTAFTVSPGAPASITVTAGTGQTATVNSAVATPPTVRVADANDNGVPGVTVTFTPSGDGSVSGGTAVTDGTGSATVGSWTLATVAGANTLTAAAGGLAPAVVNATGTAGPVSTAQSTVTAVPGTIAAGGTTTITVTVRDQFGNAIAGAPVVLAATGTANSLAQPAAPTDASGTATGTLSSTLAEVKTVTATANSVPLTATATVTVTAGAVSATRSTIAAAPGALTASNGSSASTITVTARDAFDNPVSGAGVVLAATGAGNTLTQPAVSTDLAGVVTGSLSSTTSGVKTVSAAINGISITPTVTVTVNAGAATQLFFRTNPTNATAGVAIAPAVEVSARDPLNNRDSTFTGNVTVGFLNNAGGGTLSGTTTVAAVKGLAAFSNLSIDKAASGYTFSATGGGLTAATSLGFDISAAAAATIAVNGGNGQTAAAGTAVPIPPSAVVHDPFANPVAGVAVTFAVGTGGGSVAPTAPIATAANGVAQVTSWTLGTVAGANTLTATASGLSGSPLTFTATGTAGGATTIALAGGNAQTDTAAATLAVPYTVLVTDANGNPVSGVTVTWAVTGGGGSITPTSSTNASGLAAATRILGTTAGAQTATATVAGLAGSPIAFTATATPATASQIAVNGGDAQTATVNTAVATPPSVVVRDQFSNAVAGVAVTFAIGLGGGTVNPTSAVTTTAAGIAQVTSWTLGTAAGTGNNTLTATAAGLTGSPVTFTASATAGAATQLALNGGDNQSAQVGTAVPVAPSVIVRDQFNNAVAGTAVTFAVASGGGSVNPTTALTTNAAGIAQVTSWTLGAAAGTNTLTATSGGLTGSPVTFTATGFAGSATQMALSAGDTQTDTVGATLPVAYAVVVRDASNNPVPGIPVGWTVTGGGGTILPATSTTNASGIATATRTLGTTQGTQTATASVGGLAGSPVTFTATATHGVATQIAVSAGDGQSATVNTAVATPPAVIVRDQFANAVAGVPVTFAVASGGGNATGTGATTDALGIATVGSWTLGTAAGTNTLTATAAGLAGSPVTFSATGVAGAVSASQSTVVAAPGSITASNGSSAATITVTARDAFGNPINGATVVLSATPVTGNTLTQPGATNAGGVATGTLSTTVAETKTVTATVNGTLVTQTAAVTVTTDGVVSATQSTVTAAPGTITAGGAAATLTVTARDAFNNPISGATVVLAASGTGNTLTPPATTTDAAGVTTGSLSSTVAETKTITVTINGTLITQTATVTVAAGTVAASQSSVVAAPDSIAASNGSNLSTITVTARDAFNNPVNGATVVLAVSGSGNALTQPAATTDAAGVATGTLSSTVAEAKTVSATINGTPITQTAPVTVTVGPVSASQSTVVAAPATITAGSGTATLTVTARDAFGNAISGATVVLAAAPTGGNTLTQPSSATDANGVAAGSLSSTTAEIKTISATIDGTPVTQTAAVTVVTDGVVSAAQSTVTATPGTITASTGASASTITVTARDQFGNVIGGLGVSVAATGANNAFTPSASGLTNGSGVFTTALSSTTAEAKTVSATIGLTAITQTAAVTVTAGAVSATQTTVAAAPATIAVSAGTATITVTARDSFANPVSGAIVTLVATGTGNTLTQPAGPTNGAGVATGALSSTVMGTKTISATAAGVAVTQTATVAVTPGPASQLVFTVQPTSLTAGGTITPPVQVTAQDAFGNTDTAYTGTVGIAIASNPGGSTLSGTVGVPATGGVATFSTLSLNKSGTGYTLAATASGVNGDTSAAFTVSPGTATQLIFDVQPTTTVVNGVIVPALRVRKADAFGNTAVNPRRDIQLTINTNPGGALFSGTATVLTQRTGAAGTADSGVAVFDTVRLDKVGIGYVLRAHATSGAAADQLSTAFNIVAGPVSASQTTVTAAPGSITAGAATSTITVTAKDALGNPIQGATVVLAATGLGNTLVQPSLTDASGVATGTLSSTGAGAKTVSATVNGVAITQTATVTVTPDAVSAAQSTLDAAPDTITASGGSSASTVTVTARDQFGNPIAGATVVLSAPGATVVPPGGTTNAAGVATGSIHATAVGDKVVSATVNGVAVTQTDTVTVVTAAVSGSQSTVVATPGTIAASSGGTTSSITVTARDAFGNLIAGASVLLTGSGTGNTFTPAASGTTDGSGVFTAAFSSTVAEFKTISADINGVAVTPSAGVFVQAAAASQLQFSTQPSSATAGATISPAVVVTARDPFNNLATGFNANVTLAFGTNPGGGTLSGTNPVAAASGIATFSDLSVDKAGTGYTLTASATGPTGATSTAFDITAGAAATLTLVSGSGQSDTVDAVLANPYVVLVSDSNGNPVAGTTVTWAVTGGGGSITGTTTATTSVTDAAGLAQATRTLGTTAGPHAATATVAGLTGSPVGFTGTIDPGNAVQLAFTGQPSSATAGVAISPAIAVTAQDRHTNTATGFTDDVTLGFGTNAGGGILTGGGATAAVSGVATFSGVSIDKAGTGYTLTAAATGLSGTTSGTFDISASTVASATLSTVSAGTASIEACAASCVAGTTASTITVTARDAFSNVIPGASVSLASSGVNNGFAPAASGIATAGGVFTAAFRSTLAEAKTITATVNGVTVTPDAAVTVVAAAAANLAAAGGNGQADTVDAVLAPYTVLVTDAFGNPKAGITVDWAVTVGGGSIAASSVTDASGIASATATLGTVTGTQTVEATVTGLGGSPVTFTATVNPGNGTTLAFTVQPGDTPAGNTITPSVEVSVLDRHGNLATGYVGSVTVAIAPLTGNPAGALSGTTTRTVVGGVAVFDDLSITLPNTLLPPYRLDATSGTLTLVTSITFNIT